MIKFKKLVLKILIVCFISFAAFSIVTKSSSASTDISDSNDWKNEVTTVSKASSGTFYIYLEASFTCDSSNEMHIASNVNVYVYGNGYKITGYDDDDYNVFHVNGGKLVLYNITVYSAAAPVIIAEKSGGYVYIESSAEIEDHDSDDTEGVIHDNGYTMHIYIYGSVLGGVKSEDTNTSYLYFYYGCEYRSSLEDDLQTFIGVKYQVKYNSGTGSGSSSSTMVSVLNSSGGTTSIIPGKSVSITTDEADDDLGYSKTYYDFNKWSIKETLLTRDYNTTSSTTKSFGSYSEDKSISIVGPISLTATWTATTYSIDYHYNGADDTVDNPDTYDVEDSTITLINPTKTGYTFGGWYEEEDFSGEAVTEIDTSAPSDLDLYAKWIIDDYSISYELNGGTNNSANPGTYTIETEDITLNDPTRTGYTFEGWYTTKDFSGDTVTTIDTSDLEDVVLYAKWQLNDYSISYELNGGINDSQNLETYTILDSTIELLDPTRTGYTFEGWYTDSDFSGDAITEIDASDCEDIILYAKWSINSYTITFVSNGGTSVDPLDVDYEEDISDLSPTPSRTGYTFEGWYTDSELTDEYTFDTMGSSDITLYAKWSVNSYTITFVTNDGTSVDSITAYYGTDLTTYDLTTTKTGYTFAGWYTDSELTDEYTISTMDAEDLILYAGWDVNSYTITFDSNDGSSVDPLSADYESEISAPTDPILDGYAFAGWYTDEDLTESYTFDTMGSEDITLYAKWVVVYTNDETTISGSVSDLSSILSSSELTELQSIKIVVSTESADIDSDDESLIEEYISSMDDSSIGEYYLNITVYGVSEDDSVYEVTELQSQTTITIALDSDYTGYSNYGIIRCHDGETEELDSTYDSDTSTISFSSNEFSTYAIYYYNTATTTETATVSYNLYYISIAIVFIFLLFMLMLFKLIEKQAVYADSSDEIIIEEKENNVENEKEQNYKKEIKALHKQIKKEFKNLAKMSMVATSTASSLKDQEIISNTIKVSENENNELKNIEDIKTKKDINNQISVLKREISKNLKMISQNIKSKDQKEILDENINEEINEKKEKIAIKKETKKKAKYMKAELVKESKNNKKIKEKSKKEKKKLNNKKNKKIDTKVIDKESTQSTKEYYNNEISSIKNEINENLKLIKEQVLKSNNIKIKRSNKEKKIKRKLTKSNKKLKKYSRKK